MSMDGVIIEMGISSVELRVIICDREASDKRMDYVVSELAS